MLQSSSNHLYTASIQFSTHGLHLDRQLLFHLLFVKLVPSQKVYVSFLRSSCFSQECCLNLKDKMTGPSPSHFMLQSFSKEFVDVEILVKQSTHYSSMTVILRIGGSAPGIFQHQGHPLSNICADTDYTVIRHTPTQLFMPSQQFKFQVSTPRFRLWITHTRSIRHKSLCKKINTHFHSKCTKSNL